MTLVTILGRDELQTLMEHLHIADRSACVRTCSALYDAWQRYLQALPVGGDIIERSGPNQIMFRSKGWAGMGWPRPRVTREAAAGQGAIGVGCVRSVGLGAAVEEILAEGYVCETCGSTRITCNTESRPTTSYGTSEFRQILFLDCLDCGRSWQED